MQTFKKVLKVFAVIASVAAAVVGAYFAVTKLLERKKAKQADELEHFAQSFTPIENDLDFIQPQPMFEAEEQVAAE